MKQILVIVAVTFFCLLGSHRSFSAEPIAAVAPDDDSRQILVMLRQMPRHYRGGDGYEAGYADARSKASREHIGKRLAREHGAKYLGLWPMPEINLDCIILEAIAGEDIQATVAKIERDKQVEWAERAVTYTALGTANYNDPLFAATPAAIQWHLADLHRSATGKGVTIAVIDSGIDASHPDLNGQMQINRNFVAGRSFATESHGTGVAGVIAAKANNRLGMVGVAPGARLLGLRACWQSDGRSLCDSLSLAKALHFAIEKNAKVFNLSLSGPPSKLLAQLITKAISRGSVVVAAVDPRDRGGGFPASSKGVVAVTDNYSQLFDQSRYRAPGNNVLTTQLNSKWFTVDGSSYAAAHVSGLFALLIERQKGGNRPPILLRTKDGTGKIDTRESMRKAVGN